MIQNVQELIGELNKISDKSELVGIWQDGKTHRLTLSRTVSGSVTLSVAPLSEDLRSRQAAYQRDQIKRREQVV